MPNVKYSGSKGIVQSTGLGQFHVSGVGVAHDVQEVTLNSENATLASHGPTLITNTAGNNTVTIPAPTAVDGAAGQQKLVVLTSVAAGDVTVKNSADQDLIGDTLKLAGDYCLLMWTGSDWVAVAELTREPA